MENNLELKAITVRPGIWRELVLSSALLLGACDEDTPKPAAAGDKRSDAKLQDAGEAAPDAGSEKSVYALLWLVLGDEDTTGYVQLTDSLDAEPALDKAREFSGWTTMAAAGGNVLVASGDAPKLTSFPVDNTTWGEGQTLSFANTGATGVGFGQIWLLNKNVGYFMLDTTSRVVFDPSELKIGEIVEETKLELTRKGGLTLGGSWHRESSFAAGDHINIPFSYYTEEGVPGPSVIASYDPETHAEAKLTEVECEGLEVSSVDEEGNSYYSAWWIGGVGYLSGRDPAPCVVRVKPDGSIDDGWPKNFLDQTGDRPVTAWHYIGKNKAIATVLHKEELDVDFSKEVDPNLELRPYYIWIFDLKTGEAHKLEGIEESAWGFQRAQFNGRTYLLIPNQSWQATTVYELDVEAETVKPAFKVEGWLVDWIQVK